MSTFGDAYTQKCNLLVRFFCGGRMTCHEGKRDVGRLVSQHRHEKPRIFKHSHDSMSIPSTSQANPPSQPSSHKKKRKHDAQKAENHVEESPRKKSKKDKLKTKLKGKEKQKEELDTDFSNMTIWTMLSLP